MIVVDDHDLMRVGLRELLACMSGYAVVGEASSAAGALVLVEMERPDLVVMDLALPGMDGITATREVLRRAPETRVVILTAHANRHDFIEALNAGAIGYVLKGDPPGTLLQALDSAARGTFYFPPSLRESLAVFMTGRRPVALLDVLSDRERDVFRLAADCSTSIEIARQLCISRKTVDTHLNKINRKLGLRDRAQLVRLAVGMGAVDASRSRAERESAAT
jgi:DNA-binding NarL/FixJ family response regulator